MSNNSHPFNCEVHDQSWHLLSQTGEDLCVKCCPNIWSSSLESDSTRKELLSSLDSYLRLSSKLATTLSNTETMHSGDTHLFIGSMIRLVYHSDPQIRHLSKNCNQSHKTLNSNKIGLHLGLNLLITQMNEKSIIEFIFEDIIKNVLKTTITL